MRHVRFGAMALVLALLSGCATAPDQAVVGTEAAGNLGYSVNWVTAVGLPEGEQVGDVRILGDVIVLIERPGNTVSAIALRDGTVRWSRIVGRRLHPLYGSARTGDVIHVNSPHRLYSLDVYDGELLELGDLGFTASTPPARHERLLIFGSVIGRAFAHNIDAGYYRWAHDLREHIRVPPVVDGDRVFIADGRGAYAMLNTEGSLVWRGYTWEPITARPVIDGDSVYVASQDRSVYALNAHNGSDLWEYPSERVLTHDLTVTRNALLVPMGRHGVLALDKRNGEELWTLDRPATPVHQRADRRIVMHTSGALLLVDPDTGDILEEAATERIASVVVGPNDSLVLVTARGRLVRLNRAQ